MSSANQEMFRRKWVDYSSRLRSANLTASQRKLYLMAFTQSSRNLENQAGIGSPWSTGVINAPGWQRVSASTFETGIILKNGEALYTTGGLSYGSRKSIYFDMALDAYTSSSGVKTLYITAPGAINELGQSEALLAGLGSPGRRPTDELGLSARLADTKTFIDANIDRILNGGYQNIEFVSYSIGANEGSYATAYVRQLAAARGSAVAINSTMLAPYYAHGLKEAIGQAGLNINNAKGTVIVNKTDGVTAFDSQSPGFLAQDSASYIEMPDSYIESNNNLYYIDPLKNHDLFFIVNKYLARESGGVNTDPRKIEIFTLDKDGNIVSSRLIDNLYAEGKKINYECKSVSEILTRHSDYQYNGGMVGSIVGSSLGTYLANGNAIKGVIYSSVLGEVGERLALSLSGAAGANIDASGKIGAAVQGSFTADIASRLQSAAIGSVGSMLTMALGEGLGLKGFGAELFNTAGSTVSSKIISNLLDPSLGPAKIFDGFNTNKLFTSNGGGTLAANAIGSFLGAKLGSMVVQPQTQAAVVLSSIGSAVGTWAFTTGSLAIGSSVSGLFGSFSSTWVFGNMVLPGIGAFVGFVLGALIGNLFGKKKPKVPTASAETVLQIPYARYELGTITVANNGNRDLVTSMATTARDTLNGLIAMVAYTNTTAYVSNLNGYSTPRPMVTTRTRPPARTKSTPRSTA
jgi:hypothetical protein